MSLLQKCRRFSGMSGHSFSIILLSFLVSTPLRVLEAGKEILAFLFKNLVESVGELNDVFQKRQSESFSQPVRRKMLELEEGPKS